MSEAQSTATISGRSGKGHAAEKTRFYAGDQCAEIQLRLRTSGGSFQGKSAFVLRGYLPSSRDATRSEQDPRMEKVLAVREELDADRAHVEEGGWIKLRIWPYGDDIPETGTLQRLRYALIHYPAGVNEDTGSYTVFKDASFEDVWEGGPIAEFHDIAFVETPELKEHNGKHIPDPRGLARSEENPFYLHEHEATICVEVETETASMTEEEIDAAGVSEPPYKWAESTEERPRWVYAFSATEEGERYGTHVHTLQVDSEGYVHYCEPGDPQASKSVNDLGILLPKEHLRGGQETPSGDTENGRVTPNYIFQVSRTRLSASRLQHLEGFLAENGSLDFANGAPLTPQLHQLRQPNSDDATPTRSICLADPFLVLWDRYEQFRESLNEYEALASRLAPIDTLSNLVESLDSSSVDEVAERAAEVCASAKSKREQVPGTEHEPAYELTAMTQEELTEQQEPLWRLWQSEYREQLEELEKRKEEAGRRVVDVLESDVFKAAYIDYDHCGPAAKMMADHIAGEARRGLSTTESGKNHLKNLVEESRLLHQLDKEMEPGPLTHSAIRFQGLDMVLKKGTSIVKGTLSTFSETAGAVARSLSAPGSRALYNKVMQRALKVSNENIASGGRPPLGEIAKLRTQRERITPSLQSTRYTGVVRSQDLKQQIGKLRAEQEAAKIRSVKTSVAFVLGTLAVFESAANTSAAMEDVQRGRLMLAQAITDITARVMREIRSAASTRLDLKAAQEGVETSNSEFKRQHRTLVRVSTSRTFLYSTTAVIVAATIVEIVIAYHETEKSIDRYDYDGAMVQTALLLGSLAMTVGGTASLYSGATALGIGATGWGVLAGLAFFGIAGLISHFSDTPAIQWLEDTLWSNGNYSRELEHTIRRPLLPGNVSEVKSQAVMARVGDAQDMLKDYVERVVGDTVLRVECGRRDLMPMLYVELNTPVITPHYYLEIDLNPALGVDVVSTLTQTAEEDTGREELLPSGPGSSRLMIYGVLSGENPQLDRYQNMLEGLYSGATDELRTTPIQRSPGPIKIGFYDAGDARDLTDSHRRVFQRRGITMWPVRSLREHVRTVTEAAVGIRYRPTGMHRDYTDLKATYDQTGLEHGR